LKNYHRIIDERKVLDAIVWLGIDGFGSRWKSAVLLEGLLINQTMMIEPIDEQKRLDLCY